MKRRDFLRSVGLSSAMLLVPYDFGAELSDKQRLVRRHQFHMGTKVELAVKEFEYCKESVNDAFDALAQIDSLLSIYRKTSELSHVNSMYGLWHGVTHHFIKVATTARRIGEITGGAFDVTILPIMYHWGFYNCDPSSRNLRQMLELVDFKQLQVQEQKVRIASSGFGVDFGGIAKGYGLDRVAHVLRNHHIRCGLISAGGDVLAMGRPAPERLWRIGIRSPYHPNTLCATVDIEDEAVATSGGYENYKIKQGRRISHILSPQLGTSTDHVLSATIIAPDAMMADALATATYVMGIESSQRLLNDMPYVEGIWIDQHGQLICTRGIQNRLQIVS